MQRFIIILLFLQVSLMFGAQFEIVSKMEINPMHLGLMDLDDSYKYDLNKKLGALVIIDCGLKDVLFQNLASKISQSDKGGSYWVVFTQRTQYFVISKEGFANYKYDFPPLVSGTVYRMTIDEKNKQADSTILVVTSNQDNASVYVQGELIGKTENKLLTIDLPLGNNEIEVRKSGYKTKVLTHNLSLENNKLEVNLEPALSVAVTITTEPAGATVYIDNILFGTSPKYSFFEEGTYPIRIEKESYTSINEEITIAEPETNKYYKLKDMRATLTVNTSDLATIKLNGETYETVKNFKIPASVIEIEVSQSKAETIKQVIALKQAEVKSVDIYPVIKKGTINVVTNPSTAFIELTGDAGEYYSAIGRESFTDIPIGMYEILITNKGYKTHTETIKLTADDTLQKQIRLVRDSDLTQESSDGMIDFSNLESETGEIEDGKTKDRIIDDSKILDISFSSIDEASLDQPYIVHQKMPIPLKTVWPVYPEIAKKEGIQGTVVVEAWVKLDGTVGNVRVLKSVQSTPGGFDEAVVNAIWKWIFEPAKSKGKPVTCWVRIPLNMKVED